MTIADTPTHRLLKAPTVDEFHDMRVSAVAHDLLGGGGPAFNAAYQMIQSIDRMLSPESFQKVLAYAASAYGAGTESVSGSRSAFREKFWKSCRASQEHLGDEPSEALIIAREMLACIDNILSPEKMAVFLRFVEAAYVTIQSPPASA